MAKIIATASITNTYGLALYEANSDEMLVGINDEAPEWVPIEWDDEGDAYIELNGDKTYLNEFIRVDY